MRKIVLVFTMVLIMTIDAMSRSLQQNNPQFLEDEVTTAVIVRVKVANDTIIYGNENIRFPEGKSIDSLIRKLPGVIIDSNGNISLKGLDGKVSVIIYHGREIYNVNDARYVDLGLSVNWATCNVGAIAPEGYGDFFAWGEIEPYYDAGLAQDNPQTHWKDNKAAGYDMSTYKYCKGSTTTLTKYCNRSEYGYNGFVDNKTILDPEDDVAHVKWGGSWRMPSKEELEELWDSCTWVFTTRNNVKGYVISSNKPGYTERSIFLPTAGNRIDTNLYNVGVEFGLWSNSINTDRPGLAWILSYKTMDYIGRGFGFSVRPVCPK